MGRTVEAGRAVLKLLLDDKELNKKFAATQRRLRNVGRSVRSAGLAIGGIGAAITAPFAAAVKSFIQVGDELNKMAARTGVSVAALSELKFAAEQSGASLSDVEKAVRTMQRTLLDAAQGSSTATQALDQLGIKLSDIQGLSPEKQFQEISKRIAEIEDPSKRAAAAMEIFGRSGSTLLPMLSNMEALRAEAQRLGITIDEETAQAAADLGDAFNRVTTSVVALATSVGAALAPALISAADWIQEAVASAVKWIKANQGLVTTVAAIGAALTAIGATLVAAGTTMTVVASAVGGLKIAVGVLSVALTFLAAHPIVAALLAIGGGVVWLASKFGLLSDSVDDSIEKLDRMEGMDAPDRATTRQQSQNFLRQRLQVQQQLAAQQRAQPVAGPSVRALPSRVDAGILRGVQELVRVGREQLDAIQSSAFIAGAN